MLENVGTKKSLTLDVPGGEVLRIVKVMQLRCDLTGV